MFARSGRQWKLTKIRLVFLHTKLQSSCETSPFLLRDNSISSSGGGVEGAGKSEVGNNAYAFAHDLCTFTTRHRQFYQEVCPVPKSIRARLVRRSVCLEFVIGRKRCFALEFVIGRKRCHALARQTTSRPGDGRGRDQSVRVCVGTALY